MIEEALGPTPGRDARARVKNRGEDNNLIIDLKDNDESSSHLSENSEGEA